MNSIADFWYQMTANPLLFVAVTLTLGVILVNGWTDAPNAIATCVVTRCMPAKAAILMAAVFNFLGVFVMTKINNEVAVTITSMVNFGDNAGRTVIIVLCAAMLAIVIWATLAWMFGIPTSESHALIAGLSGGAMALDGLGAIVWDGRHSRVLLRTDPDHPGCHHIFYFQFYPSRVPLWTKEGRIIHYDML